MTDNNVLWRKSSKADVFSNLKSTGYADFSKSVLEEAFQDDIETSKILHSFPSSAGYVRLFLTGGTVAMVLKEDQKGYQIPSEEDSKNIVTSLSKTSEYPEKILPVLISAIDSSNVDFEQIENIAGSIQKDLEQHDSFVITHGTDTMSYVAAALYLLFGTRTKIVLTGSQIPASQPNSDAQKNFDDAIKLARDSNLPNGVWVVFAGFFMRGESSTKIDSENVDAFASNIKENTFPVGAEVISATKQPHALEILNQFEKNIQVLILNPTLTILPTFTPENCRGLIICAYGMGNAFNKPDMDNTIFKQICELGKQIPVVITTQCTYGEVKESYDSVSLLATGPSESLINGKTFSLEFCVMLLSFAVKGRKTIGDVKEFFEKYLVPEIRLT